MRRTCSKIDGVAEMYRRQLASRPALGSDLVLTDFHFGDSKDVS